MVVDELGRLQFSVDFVDVSTYAIVVDVCGYELLFGVNDECGSLRETFCLYVCTKGFAEFACWVCQHRELDFLDGFGAVVPGFVGEVSVGADG